MMLYHEQDKAVFCLTQVIDECKKQLVSSSGN